MRGLASWTVVVVGVLVLAVSVAIAKPAPVTCPIQDGTPTGGDVQWAFTDSGRPAGHAVKSSYVHGQGHGTAGNAHGTGCTTESLKKGGGVRDLVLTISGKSKLTGRVTQSGLLGVRIVLPIKVRTTDDKTCQTGAKGTITMFASYYSVHRDTMRVRFGAGCSGHDLSYSGSSLHVYIARHGAQVNTP